MSGHLLPFLCLRDTDVLSLVANFMQICLNNFPVKRVLMQMQLKGLKDTFHSCCRVLSEPSGTSALITVPSTSAAAGRGGDRLRRPFKARYRKRCRLGVKTNSSEAPLLKNFLPAGALILLGEIWTRNVWLKSWNNYKAPVKTSQTSKTKLRCTLKGINLFFTKHYKPTLNFSRYNYRQLGRIWPKQINKKLLVSFLNFCL